MAKARMNLTLNTDEDDEENKPIVLSSKDQEKEDSTETKDDSQDNADNELNERESPDAEDKDDSDISDEQKKIQEDMMAEILKS